jgi:uncharacterized membrane protein YtjA (UPF0391 family)
MPAFSCRSTSADLARSPTRGTPVAALLRWRVAGHQQHRGVWDMLKWAVIFFVISLVAGYFGFGNVAAGAAGISRVLFFIAIAVFLIVLIFGVFLGKLVF